MPDSEYEGGSFDGSRVVSRATGAIGANPVLYIVLSLVLSGAPAFIMGWWQFGLRSQVDPANPYSAFAVYATASFWQQFCLIWAIALIAGAVLQAALTRATATHLAGARPSLVRCLETGLTLILPLIALSLIIGISVGIGLILLIVPGVILWVLWSVAIPAVVQERIGVFDALRRSIDLTRGNRGNIFLILFATVIGLGVFGWIVRVTIGPLLGIAASQPMAALLEAVLASITSMVMLTIETCIYVELRNVKDGVAPSELASIFA
jgi:hypothetical protein